MHIKKIFFVATQAGKTDRQYALHLLSVCYAPRIFPDSPDAAGRGVGVRLVWHGTWRFCCGIARGADAAETAEREFRRIGLAEQDRTGLAHAADDGRILVITPEDPPVVRLLLGARTSLGGDPQFARVAVTTANVLAP